jgi:heat shock protein HtpX
MRRAAAANVAKAWLLFSIVTALFGSFGWLLGGYRTASIFGFCAILAGLAVYAYADRALMGMLGAREYALAEDPLLGSTVARLAAKADVAPPKLYVVADGFPRAFSAGRGPRSSSLAVSTGLLGALPPAELDAVLAHELAHVRSRDVLVQTFAVSFAVTLVELSRIGGWLERTLLFVLAPVASAFVHLLLSPRREFGADAFAARLCGSPHGLADALRRLDQASELVSFEASAATEPLYPVNPFEEVGIARMFVTHPPLRARVERLQALDPTRERLHAA